MTAAPVRRDVVSIGLAAVAGAVSELTAIALVATAGWLICRAAQQPPLAALGVAIVLVRALAIGRGVFRYGERLAGHDAVLRVLARVRGRYFDALAAGGRGDLVGSRRGDLVTGAVADVEALQGLLVRTILPAASVLLVGAVVCGWLAAAAPLAAVALAVGLVVAGVVLPAAAAVALARADWALLGVRAELAGHAVDLVEGIEDLTVNGALDAALARQRSVNERVLRLQRRRARRFAVIVGAATLVQLGTCVVVGVLAVGAQAQGLLDSVGVAVVVLGALATMEVTTPMIAAGEQAGTVLGALRRLRRTLRTRPATRACFIGLALGAGSGTSGGRPLRDRLLMNASSPRRRCPRGRPPENPRRCKWTAPTSGSAAYETEPSRAEVVEPPAGPLAVRLTEVTVRHPGERHPALDAVSFDVEAGARVALIGPTGAGKSTVLSVLLGLVDPTSGRAELGGHDVRGLSPEALHPRMISGLTQDAYLFAGSIRSNLALARPAATEDEMWTALAEAGAADWLRGLDQGLDTVIGPDSALLAGGQRQRIALAVTLLARPGVLVLDEPTESLDDATADAVFADIVRATRGRTTVVASHRVRSVRRFDLIIALANGAIVQKGTHDELMSAGGYYRERYLAESTSTTS